MTAPVRRWWRGRDAEARVDGLRVDPRVARTARSTRRSVRAPTPYARMVSAPTTASEMAPSIAPVRARTVA